MWKWLFEISDLLSCASMAVYLMSRVDLLAGILTCHIAAGAFAKGHVTLLWPSLLWSPLTQLQPSHELSVLTRPICPLYEWTLRKRVRTLRTSFIEENKLIIVPVDKYYITHSVDSGPKEVYVINERSRELLLRGLNVPTSKDSHCSTKISPVLDSERTLESTSLMHHIRNLTPSQLPFSWGQQVL